MFSRHVDAASGAAHRALLSLALASGLLSSTLGAPASALAEGPEIRDHRAPVARIEVVVKQMRILDARDGGGSGEFIFDFNLTCIATPSLCLGQHNTVELDHQTKKYGGFKADQTAVLNYVFPDGAATNSDYEVVKSEGYAFLPNQSYELKFSMKEWDLLSGDDQMGSRTLLLTQANNWGIGTHTLYTVLPDRIGDYELEVEIRPASLPDLHPESIRVEDPGGTVWNICTRIRNQAAVNAGAFAVYLYVDGEQPRVGPDAIGMFALPGVLGRSSEEKCYHLELPTSGQHRLAAVVDPQFQMREFDETNNRIEITYTGTPTGAPKQLTGSAPPASTPTNSGVNRGEAQADLTVNAIKVNGQAPDGKDDCKDGKNAVAVVVKNAGAADVEGFAVRLAVDGGEALEESVDGLEAGKEREVRFGDVRLKKGEHQLAATADPKNTVAESADDNNERTVAVACRA